MIYENNGEPIEIANPYANGVNDEGLIPDKAAATVPKFTIYFFIS